MKTFISNSFSINMLSIENFSLIRVRRITPADVSPNSISAIGHTDTAKVVSGILGFEVEPNRINVNLEAGDILYVAQYKGPRLPEGATELPEGAAIDWYEVTFRPEGCKGCRGVDCNMCGVLTWMFGQ